MSRRNWLATQALFIFVALLSQIPAASSAHEAGASVDLRRHWDIKVVDFDYINPVGDLNGDSERDIAAGKCGRNGRAGLILVLFGPFDAWSSTADRVSKGFKVLGATSGNLTCHVARAGDVNNDGLDDLLVGAPGAEPHGEYRAGVAYVVFGKDDEKTVALRDLHGPIPSEVGFRMDGSQGLDLIGQAIAPAGDVNADGYDDILLGAFGGKAYVIFGTDVAAPVDLQDFNANTQGNRGFRIDTPSPYSSTDYSIGRAGDTNGDGMDDIILGVVPTLRAPGSAYVVFGKKDPTPVDVRSPSPLSYQIRGADRHDGTGREAVAGDIDLNADGLDDLIIGAARSYTSRKRGLAWVVFGQPLAEDVDLAELGSRGFRVLGERRGDATGISVSGLGDVTGDGRGEFIVGANAADHSGVEDGGSAYVVYGKSDSTEIRLRELGCRGWRIDGARENDGAGRFVGNAGDFNHDGRSDIFVVAASSKAYVLWGKQRGHCPDASSSKGELAKEVRPRCNSVDEWKPANRDRNDASDWRQFIWQFAS